LKQTSQQTYQQAYKEAPNGATWVIIPDKTPLVIRNCSKCGRKKEFYSSDKFRLNGRHTKIDIWLIYKCIKCDTTWKLTIKKGIKPHDLTTELFDRFTNNDKDLAWQYAFDRHLLKQNGCEIQYADINYTVDGFDLQDLNSPLLIHIKNQYLFELKLSALLANKLEVSINQIKRLADSGAIKTSLECDIMKYRIRTDLDVCLQQI